MATTYAIPDGRVAMATTTYTGTGASLAVANTVNGVNFQPDFVWVKGRSGATDHALYDSVRGTTKDLVSNATSAETTQATGLTAFGSTGFTVGALAKMNTSAATYVGWQWKAGGTAVSNTAGSITSSVSANTAAGFSVVTWAGNSTNAATIGHGLGVAPSILITKSRTNLSSWIVGIGGMSGFGVNDYLVLQTTNAKATSSTFYQAYGANTFTTGVSSADEMNKTGNNYVTYCFAPIAGYSAMGSYVGNSSTDGPFIYTGFRPRFILVKNSGWTNVSSAWLLIDTARNPSNVSQYTLSAQVSDAEFSGSNQYVDILSNGFKLRNATGAWNDSAYTYIYMAFAENPFKYANAR